MVDEAVKKVLGNINREEIIEFINNMPLTYLGNIMKWGLRERNN